MKRTRIGNIDIDTKKYYFVLNTPIWQMKQSEVRIFSYMDILQEQANFATIDSELNRIFNEMDKYFCLAQIVENINDLPSLTNAFYVFNEAIANGVFDRTYSDMSERNELVNTAVVNIINDCINYTIADKAVIDVVLWAWWKQNILDCNYYTNPQTGEPQTEKPQQSANAIMGTEFDFVGTFKKSAISFVYSAVSADVVKASDIATLKRKKEIEVRNTLNICDVQLDSTVQSNYITSGIAAATSGGNALQFVNALKKSPKVGFDPATLATIIVAAIGFLTTLIGGIIDLRRDRLNGEAKKALSATDAYTPDKSDWLNIDFDGDGKSDTWKLLLIGAAGLALYYYL